MAIELGAAYISILPSTSKLAPELTKSMNKVMPKVGNQAGRSMGSRMASAAGKALKAGAVVGVAAVGATVGAALVGGFNNAVNRQTSKKVLTGLYGDAKAATAVMGDLRKVAQDSPLNYESYLKAGESLAYAGVQGKDATGTLQNVGKAIVAAGGDSTKLDQAMGGVMKAVNNGGIAMMDSLGQISESGVPILSGLAEKFGEPIDVIKKMASKGQISIEDVMSVMQNGTGDTFQSMMKAGDEASLSFGNQWKIVKDNVVNAVGDTMIPMLDKLAPMIKPIGDAIATGIGKLPETLDKVVAAFKTWAPVLATIVAGLAAYKLIMLGITIGTAAYNAVLVAQKFATAGAAVQMRLLNAAFMANPIGIIIGAVVLLVAGFILMYKKVGWFRTAVDVTWAAIKTAIKAVGDWLVNTLWPSLQAVWNGLVVGVRWMGSAIKAAWNAIKAAIGAVWSWIKTYVFAPMQKFVTVIIPGAFKVFVTLIRLQMLSWKLIMRTVWEWVKTYVLNPIKKFVTVTIPNAFKAFVGFIRGHMNAWKSVLQVAWAFVKLYVFRPINVFVKKTIPDAFQSFVGSIRGKMNAWKNIMKAAWDWVKAHVFKPLNNFIKNTVPDAFRKGVASIGTFWNKLKKITSKPMKFVIDTVYNNGLVKLWNPIAKFIGKKDWKLDPVNTKNFATGGRVSGPGTSTSDSVPARLSNNEHVLTAKDVKNLGGHSGVYGLRNAAAQGWTPGLATGGTLIDAANWWVKKGAKGSRHPAFGGPVRSGHSRGSMHYQDKAVDLNFAAGTSAYEQGKFDKYLPEFKKLFKGIRVIWRAKDHFNHMHLDTSNGADVGNFSGASSGGGGMDIPGLDTLVSGLKDKMKNIGAGRMGSAIPTMTGKLIDGMADKARSVFDIGADTVEKAKGSYKKGVAFGAGQIWARKNGLSVGENRDMNWLVSRESGWNPKAQNPSSTASGLPQFINSTAKAYMGVAPAKNYGVTPQLDGMQKYVNDRYNGWAGARRFWESHNYYAKGTKSAGRGWATVGEQGPELIKLRGGEQIKSNRASQRFVAGNQAGGGTVINLTTPTVERNEVSEWVDKTKFAFTHLSKTSAFSGVNG